MHAFRGMQTKLAHLMVKGFGKTSLRIIIVDLFLLAFIIKLQDVSDTELQCLTK